MNQTEIRNIFKAIHTADIGENEREAAVASVLNLASQAFSKEILGSLRSAEASGEIRRRKREKVPQVKAYGTAEKGLTFTKKEIKSMPEKYRKVFACGDVIVPYRLRTDDVYEARLRRKDIHIEVSAKNFDQLKKKFLFAMNKSAQPEEIHEEAHSFRPAGGVLFKDYVKEWLSVKEKTVKPSTFKEYVRLCEHDLVPAFGEKKLAELNRATLQKFLYSYLDEGKERTADKLALLLKCIFDVAADDFGISSPMTKVVLPKHFSKKGSALSKEEEAKLVRYCRENGDQEASSAILCLLYFGMRYSELATMKVVDEDWLQIQSSKERLGRNVAYRYAPFTPMVKKNLPFIDFEKARNTNQRTIASALKRLLPNHHPHELRYTYVTRAKECGVNPELVMLWDGHSADKDVVASRVDRGYTDFSKEYQLKEAAKVNYDL